jgi:hypothetical protein
MRASRYPDGWNYVGRVCVLYEFAFEVIRRREPTSTSSAEYVVSQIKSHKRSAAITLAALVITASALAYFFYFKPNRTPALTEQDIILIADFDNKTGDALFDGTLKQALAVQLEQSPFLNILSDERVSETLRYMKRKPDERVTRDVAREICQRQGLKAMLAGSIAPLGTHYVLALEVVNGQTGDVLARVQTEAENKEGVLEALGRAATDLRQKLGESLRSIQKFDAPIMEATTSWLEAFKVFSLAVSVSISAGPQGDDLKAVSLLNAPSNLIPISLWHTPDYHSTISDFGRKSWPLRQRGKLLSSGIG